MNEFQGQIVNDNNHLFVELPFNVWNEWKLKGVISVKGSIFNDDLKETFTRRLISKGKGRYYLPITKTLIEKIGNPQIISVSIEPIIKETCEDDFGAADDKISYFNEASKKYISIKDQEELYYNFIFKRKSFHIFEKKHKLTEKELKNMNDYFLLLKPLFVGIKTIFRIVRRGNTTCKRGEYCILIYSEKKPHYLENVGYMGEQLDLFLEKNNIGVCWYGMGLTKEKKFHDLDFVIMLAIEKVDEDDFRTDYLKAKRNNIETFWKSDKYLEIANIVKYTPSACNSQPWLVTEDKNCFNLWRIRNKRGIMPDQMVYFYNRIDIGIFILFLELSFHHFKKEISFDFLEEWEINNQTIDKELIGHFYIID